MNIATYRGFKQALISLFVNKWGYDRDEITQKVHNDDYKLYYEEGCSPQETIQLDGANG